MRAYTEEWLAVQQHFIDEPQQTVAKADALIQTVMRERGYPVDHFDERIDMVSVDHPELAENYRAAPAIRRRSEQWEASTDELREAFQRYRSLFANCWPMASATTEPPWTTTTTYLKEVRDDDARNRPPLRPRR